MRGSLMTGLVHMIGFEGIDVLVYATWQPHWMAPSGHERRFREVRDASALPPTPERLRHCGEPTCRAISCRTNCLALAVSDISDFFPRDRSVGKTKTLPEGGSAVRRRAPGAQ
jgi:hypothetical protein